MNRRMLTFVLGALLMCAGFASVKAIEPEKLKAIMDLVQVVEKRSPADAAAMEEKLAKNPDDIPTTIQVICYYVIRLQKDPAAKVKFEKYFFELIRKHPETEELAFPAGLVVKHTGNFEEFKKCWADAIASHPGNVQILSNAAGSISSGDFNLCEKYFQQLCKMEPDNPKWHVAMAREYQSNSMIDHINAETMSAKAFDEYTAAYDLADAKQKNGILVELCKAAFIARDLEAAGKYADLMLSSVSADRKAPEDGAFIYHGNQIKGRLALDIGDVASAEEYLLKSGDTPGSPMMTLFGPNMILANELLKKEGRREVIIEFLGKCGKFWKEQKKIDEWIAALKAGKNPNWGMNMFF